MDPYTLSKIGDVTIQRVPPKTEDSNDINFKDATVETVQNSINPQFLQLPKLPPSINITVKSNTNVSSEQICLQNDVGEEERPEHENEYNYNNTSSESIDKEDEFNEIEHDDIPENNDREDCEYSSEDSETETCDNVAEYSENVNSDIKSDTDYQILSESQNAEFPESNAEVETPSAEEDFSQKIDSVDEGEDRDVDPHISDKEYEDNAELPDIKEEFTTLEGEEYREVENRICGDDMPEVSVNELMEGELPEEMICKEEQFSDKEENSMSDDADDEYDAAQKDDDDDTGAVVKKKKKRKTKSEGDSDETSNETKKQKTSSADEKSSDSEEKEASTSDLKVGNLRRNIREVMDETKLDEATLAAQMQEKERLRRVQEQLRANRDIQRQMMQARVLSLIEKGSTSIIKKEDEEQSVVEEGKPNTVVVKLSSGSGPPQIVNKKMLDMLKKQNSSSASDEEDVSIDKFANLSKSLNKPQMMTSSVSIAPVKQEQKKIAEPVEYFDETIPKSKDVVMISSSSGEDDDCIVISEDDEESEPEEDTANSGMHTNDLYNVPDDQGRVLINVGHPDNEKDVFLAPQIGRVIKPHQIGGVRFLFDNIVESLDRFRTSEGFGCILAHSMGLGKTLQVVSFCDVFLRYTEGKTVLCIMPINTLQNWVAEFNMWLPVDAETTPLKEQGEVLTRQFPLFVLNDNQKTLSARAKVIQNWYKEGGVLLIGYELYRQLCLKKPPKSRTRSKRKMEIEEDYEDEKSKSLLEIMYNALVKPGPDLVICDEGHRIKNSHASISQALKQIRSKRRVVLTGYPLQNNLLEYWCMVDFVRPNYLGTKTEFSNMFERPIQNGQCIDSTPQDVKLMRYRAHVLHSLLEGFVQRRSHRVLQETLPSKYEFVLLLRLTPFQRKLYNTFMDEVVRTKAVPNPLKAFAVCCKIWNHPDILYNFLKKRADEEDIDLDIEETVPIIGTPVSGPSTPMTPSTSPHQSTTNKRSRNRGPKGSQTKDTKLPRKNTRTTTPQPINKPPSITVVPPNTANNPKPLPPEQTITNTNSQPIPPFNAYANNQFQNFNSQSNDGLNYATPSGNSTQNFGGSQYPQQEYNVQPVSGNADFANINYQQQNYAPGADENYYQSEYNQNNYWQGSNENSNFYNNNSAAGSTDDYYQTSSSSSSSTSQQNNSQYNAGDYGNQTDPSQTGPYPNQNYNFDVNQQQITGYSGDVDQQMQNYNVNNMNSFADVNAGDEVNYGGQQTSMDGNATHFTSNANVENDNLLTCSGGGGNMQNTKTNLGPHSFNTANRNVLPSHSNAGELQNSSSFNAFLSRQQTAAKKRVGRPPLHQNRAGVTANRQKRNPIPRKGNGSNIEAPAPPMDSNKFKPGLPGGAPILKSDYQNFPAAVGDTQSAQQQQSHLLGGNDEMNPANVYPQNQLNPSGLLENLQNEELWNPNGAVSEQAAMFQDPNYAIYNEIQPQNQQPFIPNDSPSLLGGVRASRSLLNELQNTEIFNSVQSGGYPAASGTNDNLFNLDGFNYLNDLQMSGHTSFMGLLEGVGDSLGMNPNDLNTSNTTATTSAVPAVVENQQREVNSYVDPTTLSSYQPPATEMISLNAANKNVATFAKPNPTEGPSISPLPAKKDVNDSIMGLTRKGQITLKVVDKKNDSAPSVAPPSAVDKAASLPSSSSASVTEFNQPNRLPSIDIFSTGQNFIASGRMGQEASSNFGHAGQYAYEKGRTSSTSTDTLSTQTNWDTFGSGSSASEYKSPNVSEKPQNFNFNTNGQAKQQVQNMVTGTGKSTQQFNANMKKDMPGDEERVRGAPQYQNETRDLSKEENYTTADGLRNRFLANQNVSLISVNEGKKTTNEDGANRSFYQPTGKSEIDQNVAGGHSQFTGNVAASSKIDKKQPPRRATGMMKPFATKNDGVSNQNIGDLREEGQMSHSAASKVSPREPTSIFTGTTKQPMSGIAPGDVFKAEMLKEGGTKEYIDDEDGKMPAPEIPISKSGKEEPGIPYDWTNEFFKDYEPGKIEASAKTLVFFCMLEEIIRLGDRMLLFSQSLFTLDLIEDFLHLYNIPNTEEKWARNKSYFRLDGSTTALEREKLINEFNQNPNIHLFLVSTRAGSLGINLVGANRVIVFDASWNPCHDTQAVCRVYRYGQQKSCYVYRFVTDNCLEKKIYDRQINKQGMSDRIVDECNPDAHLTIKDVSNLCWDTEDVSENKKDFTDFVEKYNDVVIQKVINECGSFLSKEPFQHESLLVDRKDKKLSQAEKRMAKRGYELEKQASLKPQYGFYNNPLGMSNRMGAQMPNVRPMPPDNSRVREPVRRWIPAQVWQKQGMNAQEMTLPLDVVIPTSTADNPSSIVLKAGQKVMVLKSPKGIYMQLENGKIIAIKTALKPDGEIGGPTKSALSRGPPSGQGAMKMLPKPNVDRTLAALSTRRDVTVSPVRNRFPMAWNSKPRMPVMRRPPPAQPIPSVHPGQPVARSFPLPRTPSRPIPRPNQASPQPPSGGKQIFGPNSAVTISVANKKKLESQMRLPIGVDHGGPSRPPRDDYASSHLTEIDYDDYNPVSRMRDHSAPRSTVDDPRKLVNPYSDYQNQSGSEPINSRLPYGVAPSHKGPRHVPNIPVVPRRPNRSDMIPESLKYKKDINLTPVGKSTTSKGDQNRVSMTEAAARSKLYQQQQQQLQQQQQPPHHQQHYQLPQQSKLSPANVSKPSSLSVQLPPTVKSKLNAGQNMISNAADMSKSKKESLLPAKNTELPKAGSQHSISIFPVGKKAEDESSQGGGSAPSAYEQQDASSYQQQSPKASGYYPNYPNKQFGGNYSQPSQSSYSHPYDAYKQPQNQYPSNFASPQSEYSQSQQQQPPQQQQQQQQQSYGSGQYTSTPYLNNEFGSATSSYGGDQSQYTNAMFSNTSSTQSATAGPSQYDQYGSFYNYPSQGSQKGENSAPPPPTQPQSQ